MAGIFSKLFNRRRLIRLENFEMWVNPRSRGLDKGLIDRAEKLALGKDPGPEREAEFHWMIREELTALCKTWPDSKNPLVIFNLGANIGVSTLKMNHILKTNLPSGNYFIWAIDPDPNNLEALQKNIAHNRAKAQAVECAIGDYNGEAELHISSHSNLSSLWKTKDTNAGVRKVKICTLAKLAEEFHTGQPHFIKIDVEGAEVEVLKGGREFLAGCKKPCKIIMEVHPPSYTADHSLEKEMKFLFDHGWSPKYMASASVAWPDKFKEAGLKPFKEFQGPRHSRGLYKDFTKEQLLGFACHEHIQEVPGKKPSKKIVRSIFLEKE